MSEKLSGTFYLFGVVRRLYLLCTPKENRDVFPITMQVDNTLATTDSYFMPNPNAFYISDIRKQRRRHNPRDKDRRGHSKADAETKKHLFYGRSIELDLGNRSVLKWCRKVLRSDKEGHKSIFNDRLLTDIITRYAEPGNTEKITSKQGITRYYVFVDDPKGFDDYYIILEDVMHKYTPIVVWIRGLGSIERASRRKRVRKAGRIAAQEAKLKEAQLKQQKSLSSIRIFGFDVTSDDASFTMDDPTDGGFGKF